MVKCNIQIKEAEASDKDVEQNSRMMKQRRPALQIFFFDRCKKTFVFSVKLKYIKNAHFH